MSPNSVTSVVLAALGLLGTVEGFGYMGPSLMPAGGAWFVYNDSAFETPLAPPECDFPPGTRVPDSCCETIGPYFGLVLADFFAAANCPATAALLPDGAGVRPYLGCDEGVVTYGEECYNELPYPWPPGTNLTSFVEDADSFEECGCKFYIQGPGCYKATDLNVGIFADYAEAPYFDTRQFFVKLEPCVAA